ncbi:MarR family winged helix-turn-helix transcriptional regulator [Nocardioides alcanivorans]|uniref:MarR family winged helix-turn-helix transcriptional regulator n=1 Tax=Nocardioides alcanivorans TaxID=2897352 RepID=UPI001F3CB2AC|nr:MarR family winged helix-turn-helix transcriptional regulator [Nocardioides alcanivorans]
MEEKPDESADWKGMPSWLLSRLAEHSHRLVADGFASVGVRGYHYRVAATLAQFGPASQAEVGRRSQIHPSDMVATVNELAERQLVERAPDPSDGRRNVISLTAAGRRALRQWDKCLAASQEGLLAPLSAEEGRELTVLLTKLLQHHGGAGR